MGFSPLVSIIKFAVDRGGDCDLFSLPVRCRKLSHESAGTFSPVGALSFPWFLSISLAPVFVSVKLADVSNTALILAVQLLNVNQLLCPEWVTQRHFQHSPWARITSSQFSVCRWVSDSQILQMCINVRVLYALFYIMYSLVKTEHYVHAFPACQKKKKTSTRKRSFAKTHTYSIVLADRPHGS